MTNKLFFNGLIFSLSLATVVSCHAASISGDGMGVTKTDSRSNSYVVPSGTSPVANGGASDSYTIKESTTYTASEVGTPQEQPVENDESDNGDSGGTSGGNSNETAQQSTTTGAGRRETIVRSSSSSSISSAENILFQSSSAHFWNAPGTTNDDQQNTDQQIEPLIIPNTALSAEVDAAQSAPLVGSDFPEQSLENVHSSNREPVMHHGTPTLLITGYSAPISFGIGALAMIAIPLLVLTHIGRTKRIAISRTLAKHIKRVLRFLLLLTLVVTSIDHQNIAYASTIPSYMLYEGTLSDGSGNAITTARTFRFSMWKSADWVSSDESSGSINTSASNYGGWQETKSYTPSTTGFFSIQLGQNTPISSLDANTRSYLQVEVKAFGAADTTYELIDVDTSSDTVDRKYLAVIPYAKNAEALDGHQIGSGSGNIIMLGSGGSLTVNGAITINANAKIRGNLSGSTLNVDGAATLNGSLTASGSIATKNNITINSGNANQDATLTFGNNLAAQTLKFNASLQRFEFSKGISVRGSMSGSSLRIDGNADIWGSLASSGSVTVLGTLSGAVIRSFGLTDCSNSTSSKLLWDTTTGKFSCGSDNSGSWSGTGALQTSFDARYIKKAGETMTGALIINLSSGTTGLSVKQTLSGSIIHADSQLRSSGSLTINGATMLKSTATINGATTINANTKVRGNLSGSTLNVDGAATLNGSLTASGSIATKNNLTINSGNANQDATLTFGNNLAAQTLKFNASTQRFEFSKSISVRGTMSGSTLNVDGTSTLGGATTIGGNTTITGTTKVRGTLSGSTLNVDGTSTLGGATTINANTKVRGNLSGSTLTIDGNANLKGTVTLKSVTYTPPSNDGSASGKVLATNSAGTLSWIGAGRLQCSNTSIPSGNTIANTTSETAFASTCVIPANTLVAGDVLQMRLWGVYSNAVAPPTIQAKIKLNGTAIMDSGTFTGPGAATDKGWSADTVYTIFTSGASGTLDAQGYLEFSTAATAALAINVPNTSTKSIDTTVDNTLSITVTWGTASTSNSATLRNISIMKWSR